MILLLPSFLLWSLLRQRRDRNGREQLFYCPVVGFYVCPAYVGLDERESQINKLTIFFAEFFYALFEELLLLGFEE